MGDANLLKLAGLTARSSCERVDGALRHRGLPSSSNFDETNCRAGIYRRPAKAVLWWTGPTPINSVFREHARSGVADWKTWRPSRTCILSGKRR